MAKLELYLWHIWGRTTVTFIAKLQLYLLKNQSYICPNSSVKLMAKLQVYFWQNFRYIYGKTVFFFMNLVKLQLYLWQEYSFICGKENYCSEVKKCIEAKQPNVNMMGSCNVIPWLHLPSLFVCSTKQGIHSMTLLALEETDKKCRNNPIYCHPSTLQWNRLDSTNHKRKTNYAI